MYLGIEIGGTKLQLGVGPGDGSLRAFERCEIKAKRGALGILDQIERAATALVQRHHVTRIGIGFGGPVNSITGRVYKSHQVEGWDDFPLANWCRQMFGVETVLGNDCDVAALAEATCGAGRGHETVFYVTVGTGVGGGLVIGGRVHGAGRPAVAEIGHLRPGLHCDRAEMTVESLASGWGIAAAAQNRLSGEVAHSLERLRHIRNLRPAYPRRFPAENLPEIELAEQEYRGDLLQRCCGNAELLTAKHVAQAAADGNEIAQEVLTHACQVLGWAIAQVITLVAPNVIVVGGGVSLIGEQFFFGPLRDAVEQYVFPPLAGSYALVPAQLGEQVVVYGAIALAAMKTA